MGQFIFIKQKDPNNSFDLTKVEMTVDTISLGDLVEEFELFLKACGFSPKGKLDFVVDNEDEE